MEDWIPCPGKWRNVCRISCDKVLSKKTPNICWFALGELMCAIWAKIHWTIYMLFAKEKHFYAHLAGHKKVKSMRSLPELNRNPCCGNFQSQCSRGKNPWKSLLFTFCAGRRRRKNPQPKKKSSDSSSSIYTYPWEGGNERAGKKKLIISRWFGGKHCYFGVFRVLSDETVWLLPFGSLSLLSATIFRKSNRQKIFYSSKT